MSPRCYCTVGTQALCYVKINKINKMSLEHWRLICFMALLIILLQTEFKGVVLDSASLFVCPSTCLWTLLWPRMLYKWVHGFLWKFVHSFFTIWSCTHRLDNFINFTGFFFIWYLFRFIWTRNSKKKRDNFDLNKVVLIVVYNI